MQRRHFLQKASLAAAATTLAACGGKAHDAQSNDGKLDYSKKYKWKACTTWPPNFAILGEGVVKFAEWVGAMSGGRLEIKVFGANELIPPLEVFDAVSQGTIEVGHGAAYYWAGKIPSAPLFSAFPFGLAANDMNAWLECGGGMELWREVYDKHYVIPFPAGNTGMQMGGWFNKEINTVEDLKGLRMRIPGLGGNVLNKLGGSATVIPGSEVYTSLERGVIDAAEWIGPVHDYKMGLYRVAKYYYYPGWHEPGSVLELIVSKAAFAELTPDLQEIVRTATARLNSWILEQSDAQSRIYLKKLIEEEKVQLRKFPEEVLSALRKASMELLQEVADKDEYANRAYKSLQQFEAEIAHWREISDRKLLDL